MSAAPVKVVIDGRSLSFAEVRERDHELYVATADRKTALYKAYLAYGRFLHQVESQVGNDQFVRLFSGAQGVHHNGRRRAVNVFAKFGLENGELNTQQFERLRDRFNLEAPARGVKPVADQPTVRNLQILASVRAPDKVKGHQGGHKGQSLVPTGTREYNEIDEVLGLPVLPGLPGARGGARGNSSTTAARPGALPGVVGGGAAANDQSRFAPLPPRAAESREEAPEHQHRQDRAQLGQNAASPPAGSGHDVGRARAGAGERLGPSTGALGGWRDGKGGGGGGQLTLDDEYRAAAMARELAELIESGGVSAGVLAEFMAFAGRLGLGLGLGLGLKGGA